MGSRLLRFVVTGFMVLLLAGCGKSVTKDDYEKINTGMTRDEVVKMLGSPAMQTESEMMGTKTEILHYQTNEGLGAKAITITIQDGRVVDKQWTQL
jgi:major membrane immunogen (membrane-anchored lipoprotein)